MSLGSVIPFIIYLRYCMEFKIDYNNDYVTDLPTDLPTDDPPAIVNALCGKDIPKKLEHRILMVLKLQ